MPGQDLKLFALDHELDALERALSVNDGEADGGSLLPLAWHLRQRDCDRSLALAETAEAWFRRAGGDDIEVRRGLARINLIRAEIMSLFVDLDGAEKLANAAIAAFDAIGDHIGAGDGRWLLISLWNDRGNNLRVQESLEAALADYRAARDPLRIAAALARRYAMAAFNDATLAEEGLARDIAESSEHDDSVLTWISVARANVAGLTDDPGGSIKFDLQAHHAGLASGQIRVALVSAVNAAESFATLGELDAALEWSERALSMARAAKWPASIGVCLMQIGDVLRQLGRHPEARTFLQEGLQVMGPVAGSRNYEQLIGNLGQLALDVGKFDEALDWFTKFDSSLDSRIGSDLVMKARRGQATALSRLGRPDEARVKVAEVLALAREKGNADEQIRALRVFAELQREHALPPPPDMSAPSAELHYLLEALRITASISGYAAPAELLNELAAAYATCKDFRKAYEYGLAANAARNKARVEEAQSRALAMQIRHEIDRARADTEHHRRLAATLQATNATLETLGQIGREIMASLDASAVFEALHRHADQLLDVTAFAIYLLRPDGREIEIVFGVEEGQRQVVANRVDIDSPTSLSARCARERREIVVGEHSAFKMRTLPGTLPVLSGLFAPMLSGNRLIGVMTIQSQRANAYGERESSIFRTLCAYGAIALDNAAAYAAVEAARLQTARQEQELRIAAAAFESQEGLLITDANQMILRVNSAFTKITGYPAEAVVGRHPSMLNPPQQDPAVYRAMIDAVLVAGTWQGEMTALRRDGAEFPVGLSVTAVRSSDDQVTHFVYSLIDITERKLAEEEIRKLAFYDSLTGLPNRHTLMDRLRHAMATGARSESLGALLFIDLDHFKRLNDTRGHDIGDLLLQQVAQRLRGCLREGDTAARLGGDEFVVLLEGIGRQSLEAAEAAESVAEKILAKLNEPYLLDGQECHSTSSIGVCLFKGQHEAFDELVKHADLAMYQSKAAGRNAIRFFDPQMQVAVSTHAALEVDMREALAARQFLVHYQAQMDSTGRMVGVEALVRWQHHKRGMIHPAEFISLAEETGLIRPLGKWVLETACRQLKAWEAHAATAHLTIAVNISVQQFYARDFVDQVLSVVKQSGANPQKLKLEITESLLLRDVDATIEKMRVLIREGVTFSLDDFGTGYSSLSYLKRLPLEQLKVDQSFVRDIFVDANDLAIVRAIVSLGQSLGLSVIAEGVETDEQRRFLESCGCHTYQGYLFGKPVAAEALLLAA